MDPKEIKQIIECILFVADKPVSIGTMQGLLEEVERRTLLEILDELKSEYDLQGRAFQLVEIAEGYQLVTRIQFAPWIRKMYKTRTTNKLSKAALETLAIIAYRQPITKAEIEDIRGVSADGVINAMMERKFIRVVGRKEVVGRPLLFGTTKEFLHYFGLKDLTDMPELKDLQDILKQEDLGKDWELNQHGELVAKTHGGDDDDSDQEAALVQEDAEEDTSSEENSQMETQPEVTGDHPDQQEQGREEKDMTSNDDKSEAEADDDRADENVGGDDVVAQDSVDPGDEEPFVSKSQDSDEESKS